MDNRFRTDNHHREKKYITNMSNNIDSNHTIESSPFPVFVSGQQIGLLGGPLYTTYKVLGAIFLAKQRAGKAVYWLETNDADFNEINHIDYLDSEGQLQTLTWDIDSKGYSMGFIEIDDKLVEILETFFSSIRQTEFTPSLKEMVLNCYTKGRTLGDASVMLAKELFPTFDLQFFTPTEPQFRQFSQTILRNEAENTPDDNQCNLFCMVGKQRKTLFKKNGKFVLRDGSTINLEDHTLVPNVKTRSVCQDAYFHTDTYIAGPGEILYLKDLGNYYDFHHVKQANVQPRMSISIIEPKVKRLLKKTGFTLQDVLDTPLEELLKRALKENTDFDYSETLNNCKNITEGYLENLRSLKFDEETIKRLRKTLHREVTEACGKIRAQEKEKNRQSLADTRYLSDNLRPYGKPQERVFNIIYYMNLFGGTGFIQKIYEAYDFNLSTLEV